MEVKSDSETFGSNFEADQRGKRNGAERTVGAWDSDDF